MKLDTIFKQTDKSTYKYHKVCSRDNYYDYFE